MIEKRKSHWENVYATKQPDEVSWTEAFPQVSLNFISSLGVSKNARLVDIGGGDSNLVDHLLNIGYTDITVLDISANAIERAKLRLGEKSKAVTWIVSDILDFKPNNTYEVWHDRATFHFLTNKNDIETYKSLVNANVTGNLIIGAFSENGPKKCSGLEISQYSEDGLVNAFRKNFERISCITHDHTTPFGTSQSFQYCSFKKKSMSKLS